MTETTSLPRFHKTRIAPTPSGYLHLGNILSFSVTAYLAEKTGARVRLRIDDLDRLRVRPEYVRDIFTSLRYLGIPWDEGPEDFGDFQHHYSQTLRLERYQAALEKLITAGALYACRCSRTRYSPRHRCPGERIPLDAPLVNWRLFTDSRVQFPVFGTDGAPRLVSLPDSMKDFIVRKKDAMPSYQLASVVDDDDFGVDLVVRGADLYDSSLAQYYLSRLMEGSTFCQARCLHHPLLKADTSGGKLSKSSGATSVQYLRGRGLSPAEIFSSLARMAGCGPAEDYRSLAAAALAKSGLFSLPFGPVDTS